MPRAQAAGRSCRVWFWAAGLAVLLAVSCSSSESATSGTGGHAGTAAGARPAGAQGAAGAGGAGQAGSAPVAGRSGTDAAAGAGGRGGGTGGAGTGGSAGRGGTGGAPTRADAGAVPDAGAQALAPSAGCGTATRPTGGVVTVADEYVVTFPPDYDGTHPKPVVFGFHGANRTNVDFRQSDAATQGTAFEDKYVMAYVKSVGTDWTTKLTDNFTRFDDVLAWLARTHCIDQTHIFAIGHSSGAQFISRLVCRPEPRLRAVAPVASSPTSGAACRAIPALLIHGQHDSQRGGGNGEPHVLEFVSRAGCGTPAVADDTPTCTSLNGGGTVHPGCVEYPGCGANPTVWCSHDDPNYSGTNHGWPCFANPAILRFFARF